MNYNNSIIFSLVFILNTGYSLATTQRKAISVMCQQATQQVAQMHIAIKTFKEQLPCPICGAEEKKDANCRTRGYLTYKFEQHIHYAQALINRASKHQLHSWRGWHEKKPWWQETMSEMPRDIEKRATFLTPDLLHQYQQLYNICLSIIEAARQHEQGMPTVTKE